jgi:8-oxo-dGTP pyrophosphatase MutT (NUDIX family)
MTLRVAAIRELFEEAGILLVTDAVGSHARLEPWRIEALRREAGTETPFGAVLAQANLRPDFEALTYYSNWVTPASEPIRFDAHFYLARAPEGQIAIADAVEVHDGVWLRPADALAAGERGDITLRFPTRKHLERLARYDDLDALFAHARARNVTPVRPVERDDGTFVFDEISW